MMKGEVRNGEMKRDCDGWVMRTRQRHGERRTRRSKKEKGAKASDRTGKDRRRQDNLKLLPYLTGWPLQLAGMIPCFPVILNIPFSSDRML